MRPAAAEAPRPRTGTGTGFASAPIAIAGAGIAGLTAAIALARAGAKPLVFERSGAPHELGAGIQLAPNAVRILAKLGLGIAVFDVAVRPQALVLRSAGTGSELAAMPLAGAAESRYGAPYCVLARTALHRILTEGANRAGARIRYASEVGDYAIRGAAGVALVPHGGHAIDAAGLIGADGLWSGVRAALRQGLRPRHSGLVAWRATIPPDAIPGGPAMSPLVTLWLAPDVHAVHYPIDRAGTLNLVVVTRSAWQATGWDAVGERRELAAATANLVRPIADLVAAAQHVRAWPLFETSPAITAGAGPVTLIGDAAHPMLPFLAQGAGMAIEDAHVLAGAVSLSPSDLDGAFRAYERARRARLGRVIAAARRNGRIFHLSGLAAWARNAILARRAAAPEQLLARYDWLYGGGPVPSSGAMSLTGISAGRSETALH